MLHMMTVSSPGPYVAEAEAGREERQKRIEKTAEKQEGQKMIEQQGRQRKKKKRLAKE